VPQAPTPIDYDKMAAASIRVAQAQSREEEAAIKRLYPEYINMQFGTANQLAGRLDNEYLQRTRGVIGEELQAASAPSAIEADLQQRGLGDLRAGPTAIQRQLRDDAQRDLAAGPTAIESRLLSDAQRELALGRSLSAEEMRDASQSARAAFAARGLGTSLGSSAAEILNRDSLGRQREADRRQFAMGAEQYARQGTMTRRGAAQDAEQYFLGTEDARRGFAANVNQMDLARRQRRIGLAGAYTELDPFRQSIGPAFQLGTNTLSNTTGQVGSIFGNSLQQSGNVASFNTNMGMSLRNSALNNNAAMQAAAMQSGAMGQSGMMGMLGGIGGGALTGVGLAL
jgi:hypothetical protein